MRYRERYAQEKLQDLASHFKIVLITGARQVGKTTLIERVFPDVRMFTFDPDQDLFNARADPDLFLDNFPPPLILDEVQYAPELLSAIKRRVDRTDGPGQYILSGSQNLMVLRSVTESMAGRVAILQLDSLAPKEVHQRTDEASWLASWLQDKPDVFIGQTEDADQVAEDRLPDVLWRGSLPGLVDFPDNLIPDYLRSYVQTYLERDVRTMGRMRDLSLFRRFLGLMGALSGQEINDSQLGRELGVSPPTARSWREVLVHTYQWRELPPYHGNAIKRLSRHRKGYLTDTGLACWLQRINSPDALAVSPQFGAFFESWVVNAIHKEFIRLSMPPAAYHWRTANGAEVDLVLHQGARLFPIEIKASSKLSKQHLRGLKAFRDTYGDRVATALVIYAGHEKWRPARDVIAVPWFML